MKHYKKNTEYDAKEIEKDLKSKQTWMTYRFKYTDHGPITDDDDDGPTLRSHSEVIDDWVVNADLADIERITECGLNRSAMEQL